MPVFAHAQQHHVQRRNMLQHGRIAGGTFMRAQFGRDWMDVGLRDVDMLQQRIADHRVIAPGIADRQAALIAEIYLHVRPIDGEAAQLFVTAARCFAASQYEMKHPARSYRLGCRL